MGLRLIKACGFLAVIIFYSEKQLFVNTSDEPFLYVITSQSYRSTRIFGLYLTSVHFTVPGSSFRGAASTAGANTKDIAPRIVMHLNIDSDRFIDWSLEAQHENLPLPNQHCLHPLMD